MKKWIKYIVLFSILAILGIVYTVFYVSYPVETKDFTKKAIDYIFTKPLPVISVSIFMLTLGIIKVVSVTGLGNKSLKKCKLDLEESKKNQEITKQQLLEFEERIDKKLDVFKENHEEQLKQICQSIPNKTVQNLGEKFYGNREEQNSDTVEE